MQLYQTLFSIFFLKIRKDVAYFGVCCSRDWCFRGKVINLIYLLQPNDDTLIQVEPGSTHIMCGGDERVRIKIRDTLLKCLQKL